MNPIFFFQVVMATFLGVVLAAWFLWSAWTSVRLERTGVSQSQFPLRVLLGLSVPWLLVAAAAYFY